MPLTASLNRPFYSEEVEGYPVAAAVNIFKGAAIGINTAGFARPLIAADKFIGFALDDANNVAGIAGAINIQVQRKGAVEVPVTVATADNIGAAIYASADDTFTKASAGNSYVGKVRKVLSTARAIVDFDSAINTVV